MIINPILPTTNQHDRSPSDSPVEPVLRISADEMVRASRAKIDRSLETLRQVTRLLAELREK